MRIFKNTNETAELLECTMVPHKFAYLMRLAGLEPRN